MGHPTPTNDNDDATTPATPATPPPPPAKPEGLAPANNPPAMSGFVGQVVTNLEPPPATFNPHELPTATIPPPNVAVLWGYVGDMFAYEGNTASIDRAYLRLYRTLQLNEYLEIKTVDILYGERINYAGGIAYNVLWVKPDADMRYIFATSVKAREASFLQGPIVSSTMGSVAANPAQSPGVGGVSFACPGGGVSFACPGGGVSFACPGGGVSFACPGGGVSFACPGGGVSFACPGGGVSIANCR